MATDPASPTPDFAALSQDDQRRVYGVVGAFVRGLHADPAHALTPARVDGLLAGFAGPARAVLLYELVLEAYEFLANQSGQRIAATLGGMCGAAADRAAVAAIVAGYTGQQPPAAPPAATPAPADDGRPRLLRYEVEEVIGRGATAVVYRAFDLRSRRAIALKVLDAAQAADRAAVEAFFAEARLQAELHGAAVPTVFDVGRCDAGRPYIAMELVAGEQLARRLPAAGRPVRYDPALVRLVGQLAAAVAPAHAHPRGICHLDLSPFNAFVTPTGRLVVIDWGLGRDRATVGGRSGGTPNFTAPEKARCEAALYSPRTDVFSLGGFLIWALTGRPLFDAAMSPDEARRRAAAGEFAEPLARLRRRARDRRVPRDLATLTEQCLAADPAGRPADAGEVAEHIDRHFRDAEAAQMRAARRVILWRAAGLVVAFAAGAGALVWGERAERGRVEAEALVRAADGEAEAGRWQAAQRQWRPLAADLRLPADRRVAVRLKLVRAAAFLGDEAAAAADLTAVEADGIPADLRGEARFERAVLDLAAAMDAASRTPGGFAAAATPAEEAAMAALRLVRDDTTLSEADRATARGLLAASADEAVPHFRAALARQPFHPYAGPYLVNTCMLAGRLDEARVQAAVWSQATPDDPLPWFLQAFALTLLRKYDAESAARQGLARAAGGGRTVPLATVRACERLLDATRVIDEGIPEVAMTDGLASALVTLRFSGKLLAAFGPDAPSGAVFTVPLPPAVRQEVGRLLAAARAIGGRPEEGLRALNGVGAFVAPGFADFVRGLLLTKLNRRAEAVAAFERSAATDRQVWDMRAVCRVAVASYKLWLARRPGTPDADRLYQSATDDLRAAANTPGLTPATVVRVRQLLPHLRDRAAAAAIEQALAATPP